jgi:hypothetical protein
MSAQTIDYSGPVSSSLGYVKVFDNSHWAGLGNVANLAHQTNPSLGAAYQMRFNMSELSSRTGVFVLPSSFGTLSALIYQSGYSKSNYNRYGLSYSRTFGDNVAAGLQFNYLSHQVEGADRAGGFYSSLGIVYALSSSFDLGVFIQNPEQGTINYIDEAYSIPTYFNTGIRYRPSGSVTIMAELEKEQEQDIIFKSGIEFSFKDRLALRAGFTGQPIELTFGGGLNFSGLTIDFGFSHHPQLGLTSGVGLRYSFNQQ